jgi:hypothetical protein
MLSSMKQQEDKKNLQEEDNTVIFITVYDL